MKKHSPEKLIRKQDWIYENAGADWRDGLLLGNGNLGVVACAPSHLEWTNPRRKNVTNYITWVRAMRQLHV